jgi:hypothetical protein
MSFTFGVTTVPKICLVEQSAFSTDEISGMQIGCVGFETNLE